MKKIGTLMEEIGFNKDASDDVKKAFIKHLVKEAHYKSVSHKMKNSLEMLEPSENLEPLPVQLSFFDITGTDS